MSSDHTPPQSTSPVSSSRARPESRDWTRPGADQAGALKSPGGKPPYLEPLRRTVFNDHSTPIVNLLPTVMKKNRKASDGGGSAAGEQQQPQPQQTTLTASAWSPADGESAASAPAGVKPASSAVEPTDAARPSSSTPPAAADQSKPDMLCVLCRTACTKPSCEKCADCQRLMHLTCLIERDRKAAKSSFAIIPVTASGERLCTVCEKRRATHAARSPAAEVSTLQQTKAAASPSSSSTNPTKAKGKQVVEDTAWMDDASPTAGKNAKKTRGEKKQQNGAGQQTNGNAGPAAKAPKPKKESSASKGNSNGPLITPDDFEHDGANGDAAEQEDPAVEDDIAWAVVLGKRRAGAAPAAEVKPKFSPANGAGKGVKPQQPAPPQPSPVAAASNQPPAGRPAKQFSKPAASPNAADATSVTPSTPSAVAAAAPAPPASSPAPSPKPSPSPSTAAAPARPPFTGPPTRTCTYWRAGTCKHVKRPDQCSFAHFEFAERKPQQTGNAHAAQTTVPDGAAASVAPGAAPSAKPASFAATASNGPLIRLQGNMNPSAAKPPSAAAKSQSSAAAKPHSSSPAVPPAPVIDPAAANANPLAPLGGWLAKDRLHKPASGAFLALELSNLPKQLLKKEGDWSMPPLQYRKDAALYETTLLIYFPAHSGSSFSSLLSSSASTVSTLLRAVVEFLEKERGLRDYHLCVEEARASCFNGEGELKEPLAQAGKALPAASKELDPEVVKAKAWLQNSSNWHIKVHIGGVHVPPATKESCISCLDDAHTKFSADEESDASVPSPLMESTLTSNIWMDAKGRAMIVVTPRQHVERITELTEEQFITLYRDAYTVLKQAEQYVFEHGGLPPPPNAAPKPAPSFADAVKISKTVPTGPVRPSFHFVSLVVNQGVFRNEKHLHLKAKISPRVWAVLNAAAPTAAGGAAAASSSAAPSSSSAAAVPFFSARYPAQLRWVQDNRLSPAYVKHPKSTSQQQQQQQQQQGADAKSKDANKKQTSPVKPAPKSTQPAPSAVASSGDAASVAAPTPTGAAPLADAVQPEPVASQSSTAQPEALATEPSTETATASTSQDAGQAQPFTISDETALAALAGAQAQFAALTMHQQQGGVPLPAFLPQVPVAAPLPLVPNPQTMNPQQQAYLLSLMAQGAAVAQQQQNHQGMYPNAAGVDHLQAAYAANMMQPNQMAAMLQQIQLQQLLMQQTNSAGYGGFQPDYSQQLTQQAALYAYQQQQAAAQAILYQHGMPNFYTPQQAAPGYFPPPGGQMGGLEYNHHGVMPNASFSQNVYNHQQQFHNGGGGYQGNRVPRPRQNHRNHTHHENHVNNSGNINNLHQQPQPQPQQPPPNNQPQQ